MRQPLWGARAAGCRGPGRAASPTGCFSVCCRSGTAGGGRDAGSRGGGGSGSSDGNDNRGRTPSGGLAMRLRRLKACCCCSLRDGVTAISLLHCLVDALGALWLSLLLADARLVRRLLASEPEMAPPPAADGLPPPDLDTLSGAVRVCAALVLALLVASLPANLALLVAAARRRRRLLLPWLGWQGLLLVAQLVLALTELLAAAVSLEQAAETWAVISLQLAVAAVSGYCFAVVLSFFLQLREQDSKDYTGAPIMT